MAWALLSSSLCLCASVRDLPEGSSHRGTEAQRSDHNGRINGGAAPVDEGALLEEGGHGSPCCLQLAMSSFESVFELTQIAV